MKRLNPKNKGKRNTAESSHGSGDTIDKTNPVGKNPVDNKCFSVKTIDVNQDLLLSDEDEDSEADQNCSPTKSFKGEYFSTNSDLKNLKDCLKSKTVWPEPI